MDDELPSLEALEAELKRLRPAAPTRDFLARIARELDAPAAAPTRAPTASARRPAPLRWLWLGTLPAAAAIAVTLALFARNRPPNMSIFTNANVSAHTPTPIAQTQPAPPQPMPANSPGPTTADAIATDAIAATASAADRVFASAATTEAAAFKPITAENVLYAAHDEGLVTLDDGTTARRERLNYVDTITWKNPRTNASVRWTVPREEIRVIPVKFQ